MARPNKTTYRIQDRTTQNVAFSGTAGTIANAIGSFTTIIRVYATSDCFVRITPSGSAATTADVPVSAGIAEYFTVASGVRVSAIQRSAAGTLYVTEVSE